MVMSSGLANASNSEATEDCLQHIDYVKILVKSVPFLADPMISFFLFLPDAPSDMERVDSTVSGVDGRLVILSPLGLICRSIGQLPAYGHQRLVSFNIRRHNAV